MAKSSVENAITVAAQRRLEMQSKMVGRTAQQKQVIKYFYKNGGCISLVISDEQYESMVLDKIKGIAFKQRALEKLGLDESQVQEVTPIHFEGYYFGDDTLPAKLSKNYTKWISSSYYIAWYFFGDEQMYTYFYRYNMDNDETCEITREIFYKDITLFRLEDKTVEEYTLAGKGCLGGKRIARKPRKRVEFSVVIPGDVISCDVYKNEYTEQSMRAMNAKLREKKNQSFA